MIKYPLSCGINSSDSSTLTKKSLNVDSTWQMVGIPINSETKITNLFPNEAEGNLVWEYKNGGWYSSKLETLSGKFVSSELNNGTAPIDTIDFGTALWIKAKTPFSLECSEGEFKSEYEDMRDTPLNIGQ